MQAFQFDSSLQSDFNIRLNPIYTPWGFPAIQGAAIARQGTQALIIGGRIGGFHGLSNTDDPFSKARANTSIWVVDFETKAYYELPLAPFPDLIQLTGSSFQHVQVGDYLYIVGGFGLADSSDNASNTTYDILRVIQVSTMMAQVQQGAAGDPYAAMVHHLQDQTFQVTGGEMLYEDGFFHLFFGQVFLEEYHLGITGTYTDEIRRFRLDNGVLSDVSCISSEDFHRRDLNVVKLKQNNYVYGIGYSGVFTKCADGYPHPIISSLGQGEMTGIQLNGYAQKTNNYKSAVISVFDAVANKNTHVLMGGIGRYYYDEVSQRWILDDGTRKLPFVKSITHMIWQGTMLGEYNQVPPTAEQMPTYIGANAFFMPNPAYIFEEDMINYQLLSSPTTMIGWFYGGIESTRMSSSGVYPSFTNHTVYEVLLTKNG